MKHSLPRILLIYKISTYEYYFSSPRRDTANRKLINVSRFRKTHLKHYRTLAAVEAFLEERKVPYQRSPRGRILDFSRYDVVVTVGGDGTFLEAARHCARQKILGINSDPQWSVGRFCVANDKTFSRILETIINGTSKVSLVNRLKFQIKGSKESVNILNDVLVSHSNPAAMSRYLLKVNQRKEEQRSSGVWISTAAGSTGAICSAGGKAFRPQGVFQPLRSGLGEARKVEILQ